MGSGEVSDAREEREESDDDRHRRSEARGARSRFRRPPRSSRLFAVVTDSPKRRTTDIGRAPEERARAVWQEGETEGRDVPIHRDSEGGLHGGSHCGVSDKCGR